MHHFSNKSLPRLEGVVVPFFSGVRSFFSIHSRSSAGGVPLSARRLVACVSNQKNIMIARTVSALINSSVFGRFEELFSRFEFEFWRREICFKNPIRFFCVFGVQSHTMRLYMCMCCGLFHTCVDQVQTHSRQTHTNNIHSTDTSHFPSNCGCVLDDSC